jgi:membrane-bound lytic murein transglycosylase D
VKPAGSSNNPARGGYEVVGEDPTAAGATRPTTTRPTTPVSTAPVVNTRPANTPTATYPAPAANTPTARPTTAPTTASIKGGRTIIHTIEAGQTYYSISKRYGVTIDDLLAANNLTLNDRLSVGQQITVRNIPAGFPIGDGVAPVSGTTPSRPVSSVPTPKIIFHVVEKGQTMFRVSKIYNVTIEQIQEWNGLTGTAVNEGQRIKIVQ